MEKKNQRERQKKTFIDGDTHRLKTHNNTKLEDIIYMQRTSKVKIQTN